jgi:hypothetical protein
MHTRERYENSLAEASLSRGVLRAGDAAFEPARNQSMTFIYELRDDFANLDLDEILPMVK